MKVYLIRHAHAVDSAAPDSLVPLRDDHRYLSPRGRQTARAVGRVLREQGVSFDAVLTSPLCRAVQTAELLAEATGFTGVVEVLPSLVPGVPPRLGAQELPTRGASVAVIAHEPGQSTLGAFLCGRPSFPPFRPGQVSLIEDGQPRWFIHPDTLQVDRLLLA